MQATSKLTGALVVSVLAFACGATRGATVEIVLPLGRTAYQTNEDIHVAVVRNGAGPLGGGELTLTVSGADGSRMTFRFEAAPVKVVGANARATEPLRLNARLLRPGKYTLETTVDGTTARAEIEVYSHVRHSSYRLICWGRAKGDQQLIEGPDGLGFNLFYGHYAADEQANLLRAGVDFMRCCTMSGGHQMDLRSECDWSDPYVTRGGAARVVRQALADRTRPNVPGVHFYDEPGLTYHHHPATGEWTPHGIPSQVRAYRAAFGEDPLPYHKVDPNDPEHVRRWRHFARWKLGFMDAAWKIADFGVGQVRPDYVNATQSQYGFSAFTDGYYFHVARSLPVVSGHGGYHDYGLYLLNPSYFLEMALARDRSKPCWYLPTWYGQTTYEQFRLEQNVCFAMGIQGLITPPDIDPFEPAKKPAAEAVIETNKIAARLGTIFTTMPPTHPRVAMLYSLSHIIRAQTHDRSVNYLHEDDHGTSLPTVYVACNMTQQPVATVLDEDVIDGTLAVRHAAVILPSIDTLDPRVTAALERYAADGGLVLTTGDCGVQVRGAVGLGVAAARPGEAEGKAIQQALAEVQAQIKPLRERIKKDRANKELAGKIAGLQKQVGALTGELRSLTALARQRLAARPLAKAIRKQLDKAGIGPVFECDHPGIMARRHLAGDVEYLFAVNTTTDPNGPVLNTQPAVAEIRLFDERRPVYDAIRGGPIETLRKVGGHLAGRFRFGPGQMRVFARPAAMPTGLALATPVLRRDYTRRDAPLAVELGVTVRCGGGVLSGSVPLRIRVTDPLGHVRHDVYRATRLGTLRLSLPLAVNDPPGTWVVRAECLIHPLHTAAKFELYPSRQCGAAAGRKRRAIHFGRDRDRVFRLFRTHRRVTIAPGTAPYNAPAAQRIAAFLVPWDVDTRIVPATDLARPRSISDEAAKTWVGLGFGRATDGQRRKNPSIVGFDVGDAPVILLGTPADNPLIAYLLKERFLPFEPKAGVFPGRGRGLIAWQRDGVGPGRESITLIAHDAAGMAEAAGTLYEATAGLAPATRWELPKPGPIAPASRASRPGSMRRLWHWPLSDRAVAMTTKDGALHVLTLDRVLTRIDAAGTSARPQPLTEGEYARHLADMPAKPEPAAMELAKVRRTPGRVVKLAVSHGRFTAVGYWGGLLRILAEDGSAKATRQFPHDISALAWLGDAVAVGLSDGHVAALRVE